MKRVLFSAVRVLSLAACGKKDDEDNGAAATQMNGEHEMTMEGTWKGACPAGFKPGDMELPGGMKINMLDMAAGGGAGLKPGERPSPEQMAAMRKMIEAQVKAKHGGQ